MTIRRASLWWHPSSFPFHPRGCSFFAGKNGERWLMVISDRTASDHVVEIFDVAGETFDGAVVDTDHLIRLALDVSLEEALFVIVEQLVAIETVGERREASARHAGDHGHMVEQARPAFRSDDFGIPQELETPYENAAARVPPPETARTTMLSVPAE